MSIEAFVIPVVAGLIGCKWGMQLWLSRLNQRHARAHAGAVPEAYAHLIDPDTYAKSVTYTLAKSRLGQVELTFDALVLADRKSVV